MNLDDIRPTPGKTRVYLKSFQVYPKNTWTRPDQRLPRTTPYRLLPGPVRYLRRAIPAQVRAPHRTMCCRYACRKAAAAKRRARHADGSADDAVAMCSASRSWRCLACTSAIPISSSQRSRATSWLLPTRPYATSRADRSKRTSTHRLHAFTVTHLIKLEELRVM